MIKLVNEQMNFEFFHYPALRAPVGGYASVSSSLGKAKVNFVFALAHSSTLKEGEFKLPQQLTTNN